MNRERLKILVEVLDRVEAEGGKFDMDRWVEPVGRQPDGTPAPPSCNTAACAMGWAAVEPRFNAMGLKLRVMRSYLSPNSTWYEPTFNGLNGMEAACEFFDLTLDDTAYLFDPTAYCKPALLPTVRRRVLEVIGKGERDER